MNDRDIIAGLQNTIDGLRARVAELEGDCVRLYRHGYGPTDDEISTMPNAERTRAFSIRMFRGMSDEQALLFHDEVIALRTRVAELERQLAEVGGTTNLHDALDRAERQRDEWKESAEAAQGAKLEIVLRYAGSQALRAALHTWESNSNEWQRGCVEAEGALRRVLEEGTRVVLDAEDFFALSGRAPATALRDLIGEDLCKRLEEEAKG